MERSPHDRCTFCTGVLVPAALAAMCGFLTPTDYICLNCGRTYQWAGDPPRLILSRLVDRVYADDDD